MFDVVSILSGIGAGITYGLTSFVKKKDQQFDFFKFLSTAGVGALCGLALAIMDWPLEAGHEFFVGLGAIPIVENLFKTFWRKVLNKK